MSFEYEQKTNINRKYVHDDKPLISIITFYDNDENIHDLAYSVMQQTFPYFEWIIIEQNINNDELAKLNILKNKDSRIKIKHSEETNISLVKNYCIENIIGEYVSFLDTDSSIIPTYFELLYHALSLNKNAAWAYTDCILSGNDDSILNEKFDSNIAKYRNDRNFTNGLIRKNIFSDIGIFEEEYVNEFNGWDLLLKLLLNKMIPVHISILGIRYQKKKNIALVKKNCDLKIKSNYKDIKKRVKEINLRVEAIEYPRTNNGDFIKSEKIRWDRLPIVNDDKKRMLMLVPHMEMGGADLFNLDLVSRINKDKFEVSLITTESSENVWKDRFIEHVTDLFELPNFLDMENWVGFIEYFIRSRKIDVVMVSNSYFGYYAIPTLRKTFEDLAIVDYVHMEEWYWRNGGFARVSTALGEIIEKTYVCNERTRQVMINDFGRKPENIETVYIGVDEMFYNPNLDIPNIKEKYNIPVDHKVVLFPCRIDPQKRPFLMLEIAKKIKALKKDIIFLVVGDGIQHKTIRSKAGSNVVFAGRQRDMRSYYHSSDITLICSLKEGLALTAYESLSMGVPVITSDVGGQKELIDDKVGRILPLIQQEKFDLDKRDFCKEEIDQYVNAIIEILEDDEQYDKLSKNCRERITGRFSKENMIKHFENQIYLLSETDMKRIDDHNALLRFSDLSYDILTLYSEYEKDSVYLDRLYAAVQALKQLAKLKYSPIKALQHGFRIIKKKVDKMTKHLYYKVQFAIKKGCL